ncbi:hypothetical protein TBLA_0C03650 [Henningerozyma blattae CBS 6284]|uniref:Maintenance of mitochondrial morphology protein 1 n=1 Tax=Henningerozyma blattae (strain ATCC 34711 / CBS 6284 / DSM 70876 / NBRC 10599 / NRRL Y-10934 / UCD 77-7) TaxID=1071380 RepID=I2H1B6_HENB6|nr:hypothetical protein TBLA_0C03650 [Tetrapisispora blattae CBS 6284]CCH60168.1 hypothetical protein TBLA_0C03650 [Tetrapisispora blattae CBS 6284]
MNFNGTQGLNVLGPSDLSQDEQVEWNDYISRVLPSQVQNLVQQKLEERNLVIQNDEKRTEKDMNFTEDQLWKLFTSLDNPYWSQTPNVAIPTERSSFVSKSFVKGLIFGQLSVVILLIFFIKVFLFSENPSKQKRDTKHAFDKDELKSDINNCGVQTSNSSIISKSFLASLMRKQNSNVPDDVENERYRQLINILEKTSYNVETHAAESLDWFNVLVAQILQQFREEAWQKNKIVHSLNDFIEKRSNELPRYLDIIKVTEIDTGEGFPIFSNCRIGYSPNSNKQKLEARIDIDVNDRIALGVKTQLLLNYPKFASAALPLNVTVAIVRFKGCLTVSLATAEEFGITSNLENDQEDSDENKGYFLVFSFSPDYIMEFETGSLVGARSKLENIPKVAGLIESYIQNWFIERCVEPRFQFIKLPSIWPRSKNTGQEITLPVDSNIGISENQ